MNETEFSDRGSDGGTVGFRGCSSTSARTGLAAPSTSRVDSAWPFALTVVAGRLGVAWWLAGALAIGLTSTAEIVIEVAEYLSVGALYATAYSDTIVDMASTVLGAVIGAAVGQLLQRRLRRRRA